MKIRITLSVCVFFLLSIFSSPLFSQEKIVETQYYKNNPELGGDVVINNSTKEVKGERSYTRFEVKTKESGSYNLNFWLLPTQLKDGSYSNYEVLVNGVSSGKISPVKGNWQAIGLNKGTKVTLKSGVNTISVVAKVPEIAEVEFVRLSKDVSKAAISSLAYDEYLEKAKSNAGLEISDSDNDLKIVGGGSLLALDSLSIKKPLLATPRDPTANYFCQLNAPFKYTFYTTVYFYENEQIYIATNGSVRHFIELFSVDTPNSYSWVASSTLSSPYQLASINVRIPVEGYYYVRVRTYLNNSESTVNLNIDGLYSYSNVPIYSTGYRVTQDNTKEYNTFTSYLTGDSRLWIEAGPSIPGKIVAYNDDWDRVSDFNWGLNSRIKTQYTNSVYAVLLSSFGSYNPIGNCDLYAKCQNSTITSYFPNLKVDDAIQSAPASSVYNCISWSGGITDYWEWPPSSFSDYYVPNNPLASFDLFYLFPRYDSCGLFTRNGATASNSVIDLWAIGTNDSNYDYTHASVIKGADDNTHGYIWESKPGSLMRTFHPENSLRGTSYGNIVKRYRRFGTGYTTKSLDEAIADGKAVIETAQFDAFEKSILDNNVVKISGTNINTFNSLFNAWKTTWVSSPLSNPYKFKQNTQYSSLLAFCQSVPDAISLVYEKLDEGEQFAFLLVEDLTLTNNAKNQTVLSSIQNAHKQLKTTNEGVSILRSPYSNCVEYVKALLAKENSSLRSSQSTTGISAKYSNTDEFAVKITGKEISIDFTSPENAIVSLVVFDLNGREIASPLNNQRLSGHNHYSIKLNESGVYLVKCIINGNPNVRKIIVG